MLSYFTETDPMEPKKHHPLYKSFYYAFQGIWEVLINERNFKIQVSIGILAVILGFVLKISFSDWAILTFTITLVLVFELANTVVEELVDMVSPEIRDRAKVAKDVSASAVLLASIGSIAIGLLIFLPKILH